MPTMCIFKGEVCWITGSMVAQAFEGENSFDFPDILFEIRPVEEAYVKGRYRSSLVPERAFFPLISQLDFEYTEWSQGVRNGKTK